MGQVDDAIQAIDDLKGKLDALTNLGDIAAQINNLNSMLNALGNLADTAQRINQLQENLKLEDKLKDVLTKIDQLNAAFPREKLKALVPALLTLAEVIKGIYELTSINDEMDNISAEIVSSNDEAQATFQAMDGLTQNLQATAQLGDVSNQINDLKGKLTAIGNLGDLAAQLADLKAKLSTAEDALKSATPPQ
jgi:SMC interacting uncharacterized protein involved in chromosome segregation